MKGDNECGVKALTNVTIWFLLHKMSLDIFVRSPLAASGETRMRRTSSKSTSIEIEKPWRGHNFGWPETVFQARNSRVKDWGKKERSSNSRFHQKNKARHTLTGSSIILLLPDWSLKVSDGWHYRNIVIYLQHLGLKKLHRHRLIVAHASIDFSKRATPNIL